MAKGKGAAEGRSEGRGETNFVGGFLFRGKVLFPFGTHTTDHFWFSFLRSTFPCDKQAIKG